MLFGKTYAQQVEKEQAKLAKLRSRVRHFAFVPTRLNDGRFVWLQYVYLDYPVYEHMGRLCIGDSKPNVYLTEV